MQMQLAATQTERDQLRAEVESLNQQMSNREMVMQEEPGDVAALHQSLVEEQQMTRLLQEELEVARSEKDAAIVTLQKRMVAAEERFTALQSDMEARQMTRLLQEELEVARNEKDAAIATLQKRIVAAEERFTALQSDMEARQEELGDVAA